MKEICIVGVWNTSSAIQNVFADNQHRITMFCFRSSPLVIAIRMMEMIMVGIARMALIKPNLVIHAISFKIHNGKCKLSNMVFNLSLFKIYKLFFTNLYNFLNFHDVTF